MAREYNRSQRVSDYLKRELAGLIQQELRDPRIGMVNVTDVEVSRDISRAKVFVTFLQSTQADVEESVEVLNRASGYLRSLVAQSATMRSTPRLRFIFDASVERGQQLSSLIDKAIAADQRLQDDDADKD